MSEPFFNTQAAFNRSFDMGGFTGRMNPTGNPNYFGYKIIGVMPGCREKPADLAEAPFTREQDVAVVQM
jgi:hypothetical protein